jgi:hypothetical protein
MLKRALPYIPLLAILAMGACGQIPDTGISSREVTAVIQSMTATMWTPTPSPTPQPNTLAIINALNGAIIDADPLAETVDAKFNVLDIRFPLDSGTGQSLAMQIDVECEWIFADSCTPEGSFVHLMRGLVADQKVISKVMAQVPVTVVSVEVTTYNHMVANGRIVVNWQDVLEFATHKINGNQLGARITIVGLGP